MDDITREIILDSLHEIRRGAKWKDRLIILLVVMCVVMGVATMVMGKITYDTLTYEYVETTTTTETTSTTYTDDTDLSTEGDNASIEYNDVGGDQYNDNATHNEGGDE